MIVRGGGGGDGIEEQELSKEGCVMVGDAGRGT